MERLQAQLDAGTYVEPKPKDAHLVAQMILVRHA